MVDYSFAVHILHLFLKVNRGPPECLCVLGGFSAADGHLAHLQLMVSEYV